MTTAPNDSSADRSLLQPTLWIWFGTMVGVRLIQELHRVPLLSDYTAVATAALLIYVPLLVLWRRREKISFFEGSWRQFFVSLFWFAAVSVVIFPLLETANRYYQEIFFHHRYTGGHYRGLLNFFLIQLGLVAFPEEIFYRGYLQHQLNRVWGRPWRFLGAPIGKGLFVTSILFALSHSLIQLQWWHFSIFFPSLVFGWLREKTGAVTAGALFHALANTYTYWIALNYRL
jgi:membrane protease YdiL (CAAX protease family)